MNNRGTQNGNYNIPNKSSAYIPAPKTIDKNKPSPKKSSGGDLRSK